MSPATVAGLDLFLRIAAIGQLLLIAAVHLRLPLRRGALPLLGVVLCVSAHLLLTAPITAWSGAWRNLLLLLTDASAWLVWFAAMRLLDDRFAAARWPWPLYATAALLLAWHVWFFGIHGGDGRYHAFNHVVAVVLLSHVLYAAARGWRDDLVDARRRLRLLVALVLSAYGIVLATTQLAGGGLHASAAFGLANAALSFLAVLLFGRYALLQPMQPDAPTTAPEATGSAAAEPPSELGVLHQRLQAFIAQGGLWQQDQTIGALAARLSCPEPRLRRLINDGLGFRNFSDFLNQHRIAEARRQLANPGRCGRPILTLALELGYGSIGPFNRAFKAQTGMTPTAFRDGPGNRP